ncbi:CapA family protein [Nocardioides sp. GCM10027113]|uniref:CapA family protein n=1 Tax=unclassified Nocardioides TaxID=2615069 RepID=UPI00360914FC
MRAGVGPGLAGLLLALLVCACSTDAPPPSTDPLPAPSSAPPASRAPSGPPTTEPLLLVTHHSRGDLDVLLSLARRIAAGRVDTWHRIDGTGEPLRLVRRPARVRSDRDALAVVPASRAGPLVRAVAVAGVDPWGDPAAYPLQVPGPAPGEVTTLRLLGDIMLGRRVAAVSPADDPVAALRPLARHLRSADLTVGNLESTLSTAGPPRQGSDSFAVDPAVADGLVQLGVDAVSLANNHSGDFGDLALTRTVRRLREAGLPAFGAGRDLAAASRPVVLRHRGVRFGFLGFNAIGETPAAAPGRPGALSVRMPPRTGPLSEVDLARVELLVRDLSRRVDVVVVLPHWGTQYTHRAEPVQRLVARRLAAAGADLVVGGHPHWVQGLERAGDAVVAHSLGNLVFDMDFMEQTLEGITLTATFWGDRLVSVVPAAYRMDDRFAPRLLRGDAARDVLADVWAHSTGPFAAR